jgi:diketogulonate reductase-like aldo/keto reductase
MTSCRAQEKRFRTAADQLRLGWVNTSEGALRVVRQAIREIWGTLAGEDLHADGPSVSSSDHTTAVAYIDAMLIHGVFTHSDAELLSVWHGLVTARRLGLVRFCGVSNFDRRRILMLEAAAVHEPVAILELEYHPWVPPATHELLRWCHSRGIALIAYGSLGGSTNRAQSQAAAAIASEHGGVTAAQVLLRWAVDRGMAVIPGATSEGHIRDNLHLGGFALSEADATHLHDSPRPPNFRLTYPQVGTETRILGDSKIGGRRLGGAPSLYPLSNISGAELRAINKLHARIDVTWRKRCTRMLLGEAVTFAQGWQVWADRARLSPVLIRFPA